MEQSKIILFSIEINELEIIIENCIKKIINKYKIEKPLERLLSVNETIKMFVPPISKVTLHLWTKEGKINKYQIGGRVFYKESEVIEAITKLQKYKR